MKGTSTTHGHRIGGIRVTAVLPDGVDGLTVTFRDGSSQRLKNRTPTEGFSPISTMPYPVSHPNDHAHHTAIRSQ
jgi:hypothetical protein